MRLKHLIRPLAPVIFGCLLLVGTVAGQDDASPVRALPFPEDANRDLARVSKVLKSGLRPVCDDGSKELQSRRLRGEKAPASLNAIVLMCDFSDSLMYGRYGEVPGDFPPPMQTDRYYAAHDSVFFQHLMGDVADYFDEVSGGKLTVNTTVHPRTANLADPMWFYGNHPEEGEQQVLLAANVVAAFEGEIDFPSYDTVIVVHAGAGEETDILGNSPEQIFSTYLDPEDFAGAQEDGILDTPYIPAPGYPPGTGLDRVLVLPETEQQDPVGAFDGGFGSLGVYCFEVGLHLGMLSLSDFTPSGRPDSQGIGNFGLMGYGLFVGLGYIPPHPCAFNKYLMGWLEPYDADVMSGATWSITPSEQPAEPGACAKVSITGQEYWLLEYRLQDPNGDRRFTFSDDLNGNGTPDFFDFDSTNGDGTPTGKFDPEFDTRERVTDGEWDFAMSENNSRGFGELAAGSGVYVWHIDEGVIQDVFDAPGNLFNADPKRKSVDLEEADRIQDLDSREPSDFMLGADHDSYRAEDTDYFGTDTLPPTDTAGGARTGIIFSDFSHVMVDSNAYTVYWNGFEYPGYQYADEMSFLLTTEIDPGSGPVLTARREFPEGTDLTGSDVLIAGLESLGTQEQIILAGHAGEVFVLDGQLNEFLDHDDDPATLEPFAVGLRAGQPVPWNLPPAAGDLDHDGLVDIVLTGPDGLYAFKADGTPVRDVESGAVGLYSGLGKCGLPPVLIPTDLTIDTAADHEVSACVVVSEGGETHIRFLGGADASGGPDYNLGAVLVPSPPVLADENLLVAVADSVDGNHRLVILDLTPTAIPEDPLQVEFPLEREPGPYPVSWGITAGSSETNVEFFAVVIDSLGRGETVFFDDELRLVRDNAVWDEEVVIRSPLAAGGSFVGQGVLGRVGEGGDWQDGWPRRPSPAAEPAEAGAEGSPLVAELANSHGNLDQYVFPTRDGRLFGLGTMGEWESGWPVGGPARSAGGSALGPLGGDTSWELVAVGSFPNISGTGDGHQELATGMVSTVAVWGDVALADAVWPMDGGSAWRNGNYDAAGWTTLPVTDTGTGLIPGSHRCYPSPLLAGPLNVRGQVRSEARARAFIYNLEGEEITTTQWQDVTAVNPFNIEVALDGVVTGLYLCRLVVETDGAETNYSVIQFAVVR